MVQHVWGVVHVKVLRFQDVLKLINALQSVVHVSCQVTVEEANHVAVEGKTHRHSSFITLSQIKKKRGGGKSFPKTEL